MESGRLADIHSHPLDKSESLLESPTARSNSLIRSLSSLTNWELLPGGASLVYALALGGGYGLQVTSGVGEESGPV
jgi:hypothetical protein